MGLFGRKKNKGSASVATGRGASVASSYAPPTDAASVPEFSSDSTQPPPNDITVSNIASIASVASSGSDNSKKKYLLSGEEQDPEVGGGDDEIVQNQSIISKASSFIMSQFSANNSTIATNTVGASMCDDDDSLYRDELNKDASTDENKKSMKEDVMERWEKVVESCTVCFAAMLAFWFGLSKVTQVALLAGAALGALGVVAMVAAGGRSPAFPSNINVAFVGNSYFYVNDLPRFVQNIAGGHVTQDSVIHNSASILKIIMTGNGMWSKWATKNAMINGVKFETYRNTTEYLYDMGACSVPQLLTGHDKMITTQNNLGSFVDDGNNPCFQQDAYREYQESTDLKKGWDFVVITDQSKMMATDETRQETLAAFNYTYGPLLKKENISPIIVQPHAYFSSESDLSDLTTFTALIMEGAQIYKKYLGKRTGWFSHAHIAPVGNAFLAVYEESPSDIYPKLFLDDGIHPSAYGTFLYGCVIYATMTGYMPKYKRVVIDDMENSDLFATARRLQASSSVAGFPTKDEAAILYKIAKKVALRGYKPAVLRGFKIEADAADFLKSNSDNSAVYSGEYSYSNMYQNQYENNNNNNGNNYNGGYSNNDYYQENNNNAYDNNNAYNNYQNYENGDANYDNGNNGYNANDNYNNNGNANGNNNYQNYNGNNAYNANANYNNNNNQGNYNNNQGGGNYQYGGGNQNSQQYYYQNLQDDDNSGN